MKINKKTVAESKQAHESFELENYQHPDQFGRWLGYKLIKMDRTHYSAEAELKVREDHLSPAGRVHGGVISAFFDFGCGAAVFSTLGPKDFCSTVELKVNYLQPLDVGDTLRARTKVIFRGKRVCVVHGFIFRKGEKSPVSMATATFNVVPHK
ncbi:PaaI family thioesterase [Bdellovibrionota bacterium FG-2]